MVSTAKKTSPPISFMRVAKRVWRMAAEAKTKPSIDPEIPRGERMGSAATSSGVRRQGDAPGEDQAGECGAHDIEEGLLRGPVLDDERGNDAVGRYEQGQAGRSGGIQFSESGGGPSIAAHGKQQAGGDVEFGIGSGKGGGEDDEIHEEGRSRNFCQAQHADEWALSDAGVVPGHDADEHGDGPEVNAGQ